LEESGRWTKAVSEGKWAEDRLAPGPWSLRRGRRRQTRRGRRREEGSRPADACKVRAGACAVGDGAGPGRAGRSRVTVERRCKYQVLRPGRNEPGASSAVSSAPGRNGTDRAGPGRIGPATVASDPASDLHKELAGPGRAGLRRRPVNIPAGLASMTGRTGQGRIGLGRILRPAVSQHSFSLCISLPPSPSPSTPLSPLPHLSQPPAIRVAPAASPNPSPSLPLPPSFDVHLPFDLHLPPSPSPSPTLPSHFLSCSHPSPAPPIPSLLGPARRRHRSPPSATRAGPSGPGPGAGPARQS
jgi:hypothetical protein